MMVALCLFGASLIAQLVKNPPAMQETPVQFLDREDLLEKGKATPSSILASLVAQLEKNPPAMRETWVQSLGWKIPWRRERLSTPVFWPRECHGRPWGCKELDTTERLN